MSILKRNSVIKGVLVDITGVLYESGTTFAIPGSVDGLKKLKESKISYRFVTNETQNTREGLVQKLSRLGYSGLISISDILAPGPVTQEYLIENGLTKPYLLVHPFILPDFSGCPQLDLQSEEHDCVVVGDAASSFSFENVNKAFQCLMKMSQPKIISMGYGRYYQDNGNLMIDLGAYTKALEFATGVTATVTGKPAKTFFESALKSIGVAVSDAVMIGDDIISDVGAAQSLGMTGIQLRTGKFRKERDENHPQVKPDLIADNFLAAVNAIVEHNSKFE
jgi:phospholysine phosphohistidine inorganic pyrophosphate phosphatase